MTVTLPESLTYGKVIGRFVLAVGDTTNDVDLLPDATPAVGSVLITPVNAVTKETTVAQPAVVIRKPVTCVIDNQGFIRDPASALGVWLIAGVYKVTYNIQGASLPSHDIEVTAAHTDAAPLDLTWSVPPSGPVLNVSQYAEISTRIDQLEPGLSRYIVWDGAAYRARPEPVGEPVVFHGPTNPDDLGLMMVGDAWLNTNADPAPYPYVRHYEGYGSPEYVVSAQVGSRYIDIDATAGAVEWTKMSGTGNSGWKVTVGDTGWRRTVVWENGVITQGDIPVGIVPQPSQSGGIYFRRIGADVYFAIVAAKTTSTSQEIPIPSGFSPGGVPYAVRYLPWMNESGGSGQSLATVGQNAVFLSFPNAVNLPAAGGAYGADTLWVTQEAWPSTLPGTV